ncbi:MAG: Rpn family recombination-promoting nuclease/putative transposase [bacterium]|nr:Rpn family recombination-promoting nuclease/putative transposase [bacterium]
MRNAKISNELTELYAVALIEHKSYVDYDVAMQLLRYMICIWYDWAKKQEKSSGTPGGCPPYRRG